MKNKVLLMVMTLLMCLVCVSAVVFADGSVASYGENSYESLLEALEPANSDADGGTVVVLGDSTDAVTVYDITGNVTLDLNGKTVKAVLTVKGGTLTLQDSGNGGKLEGNVLVDGSDDDADTAGTFNMSGGTITACGWADSGYGVKYGVNVQKGEFNMTGGEITGCDVGGVYLSSSDAAFKVSGEARVYGNTRNGMSHNVYLHQGQVIEIGDGGFSGRVHVTPEKWPTREEMYLMIATYDPNVWTEYDGTQCFFPDIDDDYVIEDERYSGMETGKVMMVYNRPESVAPSDPGEDEGDEGGDGDDNPSFEPDGACAEVDCGGSYVNGICNVDGIHYMAATLNEDTGYYEIGNAGQLYWFAAQVNSGNNEINGKLTGRIYLNTGKFNPDGDILYTEDGVESATPGEWTPIGNSYANRYRGTFDGDGYTISGLYINGSDMEYAGLFGTIGKSNNQDTDACGSVKDVKIVNSYIYVKNTAKGYAYVGGVVGYNVYGTIDNCSYSGAIYGESTATYAYAFVGGITGRNYGGGIANCSHYGSVYGSAVDAGSSGGQTYVGGIAGTNEDGMVATSIKDCYNEGSISAVGTGGSVYIGGVTGYNKSTSDDVKAEIIRCYNTGGVSASNYSGLVYIGGIAGYSCGLSDGNSDPVAVVTDCYNSGDITGTGLSSVGYVYVGGLVGNSRTAELTNGYNVGLVGGSSAGTAKLYLGSVVGYNYDNPVENCYYLANEGSSVPDGIGYEGGLEYDETSSVTGVTDEVFRSGEITWKLNGETATETEVKPVIWKQTLGESDYPIFKGGTVYYGYETCGDKTYSNSVLSETRPAHSGPVTDGVCEACGSTLGAKVTVVSGESETVTYYDTVLEALAKVENAENNPTVTMLTDGDLGAGYTFPVGEYTIDLNGKVLESNDQAATIGAGTTINFKDSSEDNSGRVIAKLAQSGSAKIYLYGGTYSEIQKSLGLDILPDGYALKGSDGDRISRSSLYTVSTLTDVTAVKCENHLYSVDPANSGCDFCRAPAAASVTTVGEDETTTTDYYASVDGAYAAAAAGSTITLLADGGWSTDTTIRKDITIDLNGHDFDSANVYGTSISGGAAVTVKGESGSLDGFTMYSGSLIIEGGVTIGDVNSNGLVVYAMYGDSTVNINGGTVNSVFAVGYNDKTKENSTAGDVNVIVSGGAVNSLGASTGNISVTGGTITRFDVQYADGFMSFTDPVISLSGGVFGQIASPTDCTDKYFFRDLLKEGYGYQSTTDSTMVGMGTGTTSAELNSVRVVKCETHDYLSSTGRCNYCNGECTHESWTDAGKCDGCGVAAVAKLSGSDTDYYATLSAAVAAIEDSMTSIYLLDDVTEDITIDRTVNSIDLQGHRIDGIVTVSYGSGRVTIYDSSDNGTGYIKELNVEATDGVAITGGSYGKITVNEQESTVNDLLKSYGDPHAYQKADGSCYEYNVLASVTTIENVKVVVCNHATPNEDGKCPYCNYAVNTERMSSNGTKVYHSNPTLAMMVAEDGDVITMLLDYSYSAINLPFNHSGCKVTFDLNGWSCGSDSFSAALSVDAGELTIKDSSEDGDGTLKLGSYSVADGATLNIEGGKINANLAFTVESGGTLNVSGGVYTGYSSMSSTTYPLTYESGAKGSISGGAFNAIKAEDGLGKLLADGYYFKTSDGAKYYSDYTGTELTNVTVQPVPITKLEISPDKDSYTYGDTVTLTAVVTQPAGRSETVSYTWYYNLAGNENEDVNEQTIPRQYYQGDKLIFSAVPFAYNYIFRCEATVDGYIAEQTIDVNVARATLVETTDYTAPTAESNLVYDGSYQALVTGGVLNVSDAYSGKFMYRLDNDTSEWSTDIPIAMDAGEYRVYWYISGGMNYSDVGSEDEPAGEFEIVIAKKPITVSSVDVLDKEYDGTERAYVDEVYFDGGDLEKIIQYENGDYTGDYGCEAYFVDADDDPDANAGVNKTVKVSIYLDDASNYIFDDDEEPTTFMTATRATIEKANAPDVTRKGSITVLNGLAKSYDYDFAGLLPDVPVLSDEGVEFTYGDVEYTFNYAGSESNASEIDSNYLDGIMVDESNASKVTLSTFAYDTTTEGQIGTLRMTVSTTNYEKFVLEAEVFARNRKVPTGGPTISSSNITYGEELDSITLSGSMKYGDAAVDGTFAWVDGTIRPDAQDAYAAEWKFTPSDENYGAATGTVNITVNKAEADYTAPVAKADLTYRAAEMEIIMAGGSSDGTIMYSMSEDGWSEDIPVARNAGDYTVYWYIKGDANHNDSAVSDVTVKIAPLDISKSYAKMLDINYSYTDLVYTGVAQSPVWTIKAMKPGEYNPLIGANTPSVLLETLVLDTDYTVSVTPQTNAGDYTGNYAVTIIGEGNYSGSVSKDWSIAKATISDGLGGTTTGLVYTLTGGTIDLGQITGVPTDAGTVSYSVAADTLPEGVTGASVSGRTLSFTLDGEGAKGSTYTIPVTVSSGNYEAATVDMTVKLISKSKELLTVAIVGWTYGDVARTPSFDMPDDATDLKILYSRDGSGKPTESVPTNAGNYTVAVQYETATEIWVGGADFTISPAALTGVSVEQVGTLTYNGEAQTPTVSVKKGDTLLTSDDYVLDVDAKTDAGDYTVSVIGQGNYNGTVGGDWKIAKKAVTVTPVVGQSKVYGEADPVLTYNSDLSGILAEKFAAAVTGALSRAAGEDAGTYAIGVGSLSAGNNFALNFSEDTIVNFTIEKAAPVVPTDLTGYKDNRLSTVELPEGWSWLDGDAVMSDSGDQEFAARYAGSANYRAAESVSVTVKVAAKENKQLAVTIDGWTYGEDANAPAFDKPADATDLKIVYSHNMTGTPTESVPTNAGKHIVSVRYETATEIWVGGADFTISPAALTGVSVEQVGTLTYNGEAQTAEVVTNGNSVNDQAVTFTYTASEAEFGDMPGFTDADSYTVYYKASAANHNDATGQFTVTIIKATPVISDAKADVVYGQVVADSDISAVTGGVPGSFVWKNVTSYGDVAEAAKTFYADFTPSDSKNYNSVENIAVAVTVGQAAYTGNRTADGSARYGADGAVDISGCIAPGGTVAYVSVVDNDGILAATPVVDGSRLSYTLKNNAALVGRTATVNIEVTSGNYTGYTVAVTITVSDKDAQEALSISGVSSDTSLIYGQIVTLATVGGSGDGAVTYEIIDGGTGAAAISGNVLKATGAGTVYVRATKAADAVYAEAVSNVVEVYIAKATPTGAPAYKPVSGSGKTLADAELTGDGGTFSIPGSVMWVDDEGNALTDDTPVSSNIAYKWVFIPTDSTNYEEISDSVILWKRSSGGGGGGGSSSGSSSGSSGTSVTVPVSSDHGSVKVDANVSKGTATVEVSDKQIDQVVADGAGSVTVDVSGLKNIDSATVPSHVVEKTNEAENTGLTVTLPTGSVTLDETALDSVSEAADGEDVTVSVVSVPTTALPETFKDAIGMEPTVIAVVDVDILINDARSGSGSGTRQSSFGGGKIRISIPYTAKAGEDTSNLTVWFIRDDGTIENMGGWYDAENKCFVFETDHLSRYVLVNTNGALRFIDVPVNSWYAAAVNWAVSLGVTNGYETDRFAPDMSCTRAQIVTFLWRAAGSPESAAVVGFSDVAAGAYYAEAVAWAVEQGITTGTSETMFSPDETCTRAQAVSFLFRYAAAQSMGAVTLQELVSGYGDAASVQGYALPAFNWALASGIVQGEDGKLLPNNDCTRAQIVTMLYRLLAK